MDWESSGVEGFDLGPFPQGQTVIAKLKSAYNSLIIGCRGFGCETNQSFGFPKINTASTLYYLPTDKLCYKFRCNKSYLLCK